MTKATKNIFICLLFVGVVVGSFFFNTTVESPPGTIHPTAKEVQQKHAQILHAHENKMQVMEYRADSLQLIVDTAKAKMQSMQVQVMQLKSAIRMRVSQMQYAIDTSQRLAHCNALQSQVKQLLSLTDAQDSLCHQTVDAMEMQLQTKDSLLALSDERILQTDSLLMVSTGKQFYLEKQVEDQHKQITKQSRRLRIAGAGLMLASGITLTLLLLR